MVPEPGFEPKNVTIQNELMQDRKGIDRGVAIKGINHTTVGCMWEALQTHGAKIPVTDIENGDQLGFITKEALEGAGKLLHDKHPRMYGSILSEDFDANDADVWFQLAIMGDVVYG